MIKNVILCGGSGTRLWPLSRKLMPKQFLQLFDNKTKSLFQKTIERNSIVCNEFIIITNEEQYFLSLDQIEELSENSKFKIQNPKFLLEETAKNTAAAIAFAAFESNEDDILFITPSDHLIKNEEKYVEAVNKAKNFAKEGYLVTFGIKPTTPHTGYGYIESRIEDLGLRDKVLDVIKFHEKPDLETAQKYLKQNTTHYPLSTTYYLWNSGMFMFKAGVYLEELRKHSPEVYEETLKSYEKRRIINDNQIRLKDMQNIPDISIDYAVMENSKNIKVILCEFEWNDVGSFDSLIEEIESIESIEIDSENNFYYGNKKVIATIGLKDFIVIDTKDALLIAKKTQTQKVKEIVNQLKTQHSHLKNNPKSKIHNPILNSQLVVHRPWGTYETLIEDEGYKVKKIIVRPGKRLSLQKHFHRNEHWVVVCGTAEVQVGENKFLLKENESTYIKMGEIHRLANPGKIPLVVIEVQVGEYTGEDDIIRIEDDYERTH